PGVIRPAMRQAEARFWARNRHAGLTPPNMNWPYSCETCDHDGGRDEVGGNHRSSLFFDRGTVIMVSALLS
ncbi:MAG: hypothetical protein WAU86_03945, partial [Oricola sp.]